MERKIKAVAITKSPAKDAHLREGKGFSLKEIKEAGKDVKLLKELKIQIDYFRKSAHLENVEKLKKIKVEKKKIKKREAFVKKEKKKTQFKPKKEKPKVEPSKIVKKEPKKPEIKAKAKPKKEKVKPVKIEKVKVEVEGTALTKLTGLGAATAKKFVELGVNSIEELCNENAEELASLIKGVSIDRLKKWIEEGKELTK